MSNYFFPLSLSISMAILFTLSFPGQLKSINNPSPFHRRNNYYDNKLNKVPTELTQGQWVLTTSGVVLMWEFYNKGQIGYLQRTFHSDLTYFATKLTTIIEGKVIFKNDLFIFQPLKGQMIKIKSGQSPVYSKASLSTDTLRWEIRKENGNSVLVTFKPDDSSHLKPVFHFQNVEK